MRKLYGIEMVEEKKKKKAEPHTIRKMENRFTYYERNEMKKK